MTDHPDLEALERGELAAAETAEAEAHVAACEECRKEQAWLRAERDLFARRRQEEAGAPAAALWRKVEERVSRRRGSGGRLALVAVALTAAAVIVVTVWPRGQERIVVAPAPAPDALTVAPPSPAKDDLEASLDRAEAAYVQAIAELEADYHARRASLDPAVTARLDARFAAVHRTMDEARAAAGRDREGRFRTLQAYRQVVTGLQAEANAIAEERP